MEFEYKIQSIPNNITKVEKICAEVCKKANFDEDSCDDFAIAATEAANNAIIHGNKSNPAKNITLTFKVYENEVTLKISDEGEGFEIKELRDPLAPENVFAENGRGILIIKALVDKVFYEFDKNCTSIVLFKKA
ncbi:MAG: ATP-binding protein [Calditrichaeota bacterium]|nr:MAG: ATP-binding protein [Calditrichota bacterium]